MINQEVYEARKPRRIETLKSFGKFTTKEQELKAFEAKLEKMVEAGQINTYKKDRALSLRKEYLDQKYDYYEKHGYELKSSQGKDFTA